MTDANDAAEADDRFEAFRADLESSGLADPNPARDSVLGKLGIAMMAIGVAAGLYAYFGLSTSSTNPLQQRDAIVVALIGVSVTVVGSVMYLGATLATFLRFWFARFSHDQHQLIERLTPSDE